MIGQRQCRGSQHVPRSGKERFTWVRRSIALNVQIQLVLADSARLKPANTSEGTEPSADRLAKSMSLRIGMLRMPPTGHVSVLVRPKHGHVLVTATGRCWHFAEQYCVPQSCQQIDYRNCYASILLSVPQLNSLQGQYDPRLFNTAPVILQYLYIQFSVTIVTGA